MTTHDGTYYLRRAPMSRALAHLALPMMAATTVGVVYGAVNAGFIGSLHSTALLAAITFGLPLTAVVMAVGGVFGTGGSTAVARLLGELQALDDGTGPTAAALRERIRRLSAFTVWGAALAGAVVGIAGLVALHPLTHLLGATGDAFAPTADYVTVLLAGTPVLAVAFAIEQLVRAQGATRVSMVGIVVSTAVNLGLDVLLILVLRWGVTGAALAIVGSNVVTVAWFAVHLHRRSPELRIGLRWFRPDGPTTRTVLSVGASELLMSGFLTVTAVVFNNVAARYGDGVLAAFGVAQRIVQLPEMLAMGVALGVMPLLATSFGARDTARLRSALLHSVAWVAGCVLVFTLPVFVLRERVLTLFSADPAVLTTGLSVLTAMLVAALFNGFTGLATTLFQSTGQAVPATVMSVAQGVLFVPVLLAARAALGLTGVIWAMPVTEVICFVVAAALVTANRARTLAPAGTPSPDPVAVAAPVGIEA